MKEYYIYKITCLMDEWNGKFYIGKHYGKLDDNYTGSGRLIREYFKKYDKIKGLTYDKQILEVGDENSICDLERDYIRKGQQSELCLNLIRSSSKGHFEHAHSNEAKQKMSISHKGMKHSEEAKQRISEAKKGKKRKPFSAEHIKHMCEAQKGQNNPMYGKKHSEETRKKMCEAQKGKQLSAEHKRKLSETAKRRWARNQ